MDNNKERTDQLFRERLSVYEEIPADQVWDKIASRLEMEKRRKLVYLFLRIAAGMTLLFSLGLGYYLVNNSSHQKARDLVSKQPTSEKSVIIPSNDKRTSNSSDNQSLITSDKSIKNENKPLRANDIHTNLLSENHTYIYKTSSSDAKIAVLTRMSMHEPSLFSVPAPHRLGYRRLSPEEMQEQTAALTADNSENTY